MQDDLFSFKPPAKYPNGPGWSEPTTSKAAAVAIRPALTYQQRTIMEWLAKRRDAGAIREEIAAGCALRESSTCGRLAELCEAGLVVKLEETRPTSSRRQAHVYLHKDFATQEESK